MFYTYGWFTLLYSRNQPKNGKAIILQLKIFLNYYWGEE